MATDGDAHRRRRRRSDGGGGDRPVRRNRDTDIEAEAHALDDAYARRSPRPYRLDPLELRAETSTTATMRDTPEVLQPSRRSSRHRRHRSEKRSGEYVYRDRDGDRDRDRERGRERDMDTISEEGPVKRKFYDEGRQHRRDREPRVSVREVSSSSHRSPPLADILKR